jgi:flagellar basal body-associated protein FliL
MQQIELPIIFLQQPAENSNIPMLLMLVIILTPLFLQIYWVFRSLSTEKKGFNQLFEASQELNSKTLQEASTNLIKSNKLKYSIIFLMIFECVISIIIAMGSSSL